MNSKSNALINLLPARVSILRQYVVARLPHDIQSNIIEFFGRDEWTFLRQNRIFSYKLNFDLLNNYCPVNIHVLQDGSLSRNLNVRDLHKRFIVSDDTIKYLSNWRDIVEVIVLNSTFSRFDTVPDDIVFKEYVKKTGLTFADIDFNNNLSDSDDDDDINESQIHHVYYLKITIPHLPNLKRIYMGRNTNYILNLKNIEKRVQIFWLDTATFSKDSSLFSFSDSDSDLDD
jgi:hypothetical protein